MTSPARAATSLTAGLLHDDDPDEGEGAEFDPDAASDDDDDGASSDDDGETAAPDHAVLSGSLHLNDEGRVVCAGTWCLHSERDQPPHGDGRLKFKWKSQARYAPPSADGGARGDGRALFDARRPSLARPPPAADGPAAAPPTRRTLLFDGFFFEPAGGKKMKERDVELFFTTGDGESTSATVEYRISGRGSNDYGPFVLDGTYAPPPPTEADAPGKEDDDRGREEDAARRHDKHRGRGPAAAVLCRKTYGAGGAAKTTRGGARGRRRADSADDDFGDERADHGEVAELHEDAALSVEALRRKYYGGGGEDSGEEGDDGGGKAGVKRPRPEESDDDECGF